MTKQQLLLQLARQRQQHVPEGYLAIGDYHQGAYECDSVSPYTKSAHNLDAHIMVILQDWCSHEYLSKPLNPDLISLGLDPKLPTSRHLEPVINFV